MGRGSLTDAWHAWLRDCKLMKLFVPGSQVQGAFDTIHTVAGGGDDLSKRRLHHFD